MDSPAAITSCPCFEYINLSRLINHFFLRLRIFDIQWLWKGGGRKEISTQCLCGDTNLLKVNRISCAQKESQCYEKLLQLISEFVYTDLVGVLSPFSLARDGTLTIFPPPTKASRPKSCHSLSTWVSKPRMHGRPGINNLMDFRSTSLFYAASYTLHRFLWH